MLMPANFLKILRLHQDSCTNRLLRNACKVVLYF